MRGRSTLIKLADFDLVSDPERKVIWSALELETIIARNQAALLKEAFDALDGLRKYGTLRCTQGPCENPCHGRCASCVALDCLRRIQDEG